MNLQELLPLIDNAIDDCARIIQNNPQAVLSEGDFERLLSDCISKGIGYNAADPDPNRFSVHTQISHYKDEDREVDARVDILLVKPKDIIPHMSHNKKFVIYTSAESVALELKYIKGNKQGLSEVKKDINKISIYDKDSYYYSIVLLDSSKRVNTRVRNILFYFNAKINENKVKHVNSFFCKVIVKE